jgi:hypothetical protein
MGKHNGEASDFNVGVILINVRMCMDWVLDTQCYTTCEGPPYPICTFYKYENRHPQSRLCIDTYVISSPEVRDGTTAMA